ncbi:HIT-like domain-containing protein [Phyllosticta capitalensis]
MGEPKELALRYPQSCPFCSIAAAYRYAASAASPSPAAKQPQRQDESARSRAGQNITAAAAAAASSSSLLASIPSSPSAIDPAKVSPAAYVVLSAPRVLAFLDIMPMTRGHLLVTTRRHRRKVEELVGEEGRDIGFWLPLLAKTVATVIGVPDYNIVQNNGIRAAQVVPHVHFHIIPRPASLPALQNKSWTMFGRGSREDLDDDEAAALAARMRNTLRVEVEALARWKGRRARGRL